MGHVIPSHYTVHGARVRTTETCIVHIEASFLLTYHIEYTVADTSQIYGA